jgi:hypothetical protein
MLTRLLKLTLAVIPLLCIVHTANLAKSVLMQNDFLDGTAAVDASWFNASPLANVSPDFPNSTTILPAHDTWSAFVPRMFSLGVSSEAVLFFALLIGAICFGFLGFTRLAAALEQRHAGWPEKF